MRRKAAGTLRVAATGRAAHSGSAPDKGRNALLALALLAPSLAAHHDPGGPERLSVVPTVMHAGEAFNVVPAAGELIFDMRADRLEAFEPVLGAVPDELDGVGLTARIERRWPGMDSALGDRRAARPRVRRARPADRRRLPRRRQRREPLRLDDPADRRRSRARAAAARTRPRSSCSSLAERAQVALVLAATVARSRWR